MKKKELKKIPIAVMPSGKGTKGIGKFIGCKSYSGGLLLNLFCEGESCYPRAALRVFASHDDYITEDLREAKPKWLCGRIDHVANVGYYRSEQSDYQFISDEDKKLYEEKFGKIETNWWEPIYMWQSSIMNRKRKEKHLRELKHSREMQDLIPKELPPDWDSWRKEKALEEFYYINYQPGKRKEILGYCTACQSLIKLDQHKQKIKRGLLLKCPCCGRSLPAMPPSAQLNGQETWRVYRRYAGCNRKWLALFQKVKDGFVIRYFEEVIKYPTVHDVIKKPEITELEQCRTFYINGKIETFEKRIYKQDLYTWCPDNNVIDCGASTVYLANLQEVLKGTEYQYCSIDLYQKYFGTKAIFTWRYMNNFKKISFAEYLLKMGDVEIVNDLCRYSYGYSRCIDIDGKKPEDILKLHNKQLLKLALTSNPNMEELKLYQTCEKVGYIPKAEDIKDWVNLLGGDDETFTLVKDNGAGIRRFINYITKQITAGYSARSVVADWKDYLRIVSLLKLYDLKDRYYLLPQNLKAAHDGVISLKKEADEQAVKKLEEQATKLMKTAIVAGKYGMISKDLMMVVPQNAEEIKEEGKLQHHCVGTYVERVAKGETMILFVRQKAKPKEPYFTVEYKNGKVAQCRGKRNCDPPTKVKAFVKAWEMKMHEREAKKA